MRAWLVVVVVAVGCDSGGTQVDCPGAAGTIVSVGTQSGDQSATARAATIVARCADDKWTAEAASCIHAATTSAAVEACELKHLTQHQQERLANGSVDAVIIRFRGFRDEMCACKDADCSKRVTEEMTKWGTEMAKRPSDPPKMSDAQAKEVTAVGTQMGECMQKAMTMPTSGATYGTQQ